MMLDVSADRTTVDVSMSINGRLVRAPIEPRMLLVDFIRNAGRLHGTRIGCDEGVCGACTVDLDGCTAKSCLVLAVQADGSRITTVEGIGDPQDLAPIQDAFVRNHALQCGYCTSGMLMSARDLFSRLDGRAPSDYEIRQGLSGNICRCTGYKNIIHACKAAAGQAASLTVSETETSFNGKWIGRPLARREDKRLVTGGGRFAADYDMVGELHVAIVRSTRAHAKILSIDMEAARNSAGVELVMTGLEATKYWKCMPAPLDTPNLPRRHAMAVDKVIFYGEPIAFVVAENAYLAEDAAQKVVATYEDLPITVDPVASAELDADDPGLLYPEWGSNVQIQLDLACGDVDAKFADASLVLEDTLTSQRYGTMPMETRMVNAFYDKREEKLVVRMSTQVPHPARMFLSEIFNIPESSIQILAGDVGGGFGSKLALDPEYIPVLAAIVLGRPIKWFESRSEWFLAGPGARDVSIGTKVGFAANGTILAMETDILADMGVDGAERGAGLGMPLNCGVYSPGPYKFEDYRTRVRCVVTNKAPYGAIRGYGKDLANMAVERMLDRAAPLLGLDEVEIRRRNITTTYPFQLCTGPIIENGSLAESLDELVLLMDLNALRARQRVLREQGKFIGFGIATYLEPCGASFPGSSSQNYESATVRIAADGSVHVLTAIQNIGQGIETAYAQVVADTLGCKLNSVRVSWGDTTATPFGSGTFSSRGAMYAVGAVSNASTVLRERLLWGASVLLSCPREELRIEDGVISCYVRNVSCTFADVARASYLRPGSETILIQADAPILEATGTYRNPQVNWQPDAQGRVQMYPSHPGGSAGALVEVIPETGEVKILKIWAVSDHGTVLNPVLMEGQTTGGIVQQIGGTMYEMLAYDKNGVPLTKTLRDYGMPTIWVTPEIELGHLVTPSPATKVGAKGGGEDGCVATTTVIMAAVENALKPFGARVSDSPLSLERVRGLVTSGSQIAGDGFPLFQSRII
jgi:carbon-monoxide dehydrogenase large subunit